jgi:hypothetical protein
MLGTVRRKKQQLGYRSHSFLGFKKRFTEPAAQRRSARLAGCDQIHTAPTQITCKHAKLS